MPSQEVLNQLDVLRNELDTISSAVKHIDDASKVAEKAAGVIKKITDLVGELKQTEEMHRETLANEYKNNLRDLKLEEEKNIKILQAFYKDKIDELDKQLRKVLHSLTNNAAQLRELTDETKMVNEAIAAYFEEIRKINFPERLGKIDNQISSINIGIGNLHSAVINAEKEITQTKNKLSVVRNNLSKQIKINRIILVSGFIVIILGLVYQLFKLQ